MTHPYAADHGAQEVRPKVMRSTEPSAFHSISSSICMSWPSLHLEREMKGSRVRHPKAGEHPRGAREDNEVQGESARQRRCCREKRLVQKAPAEPFRPQKDVCRVSRSQTTRGWGRATHLEPPRARWHRTARGLQPSRGSHVRWMKAKALPDCRCLWQQGGTGRFAFYHLIK